VERLIACLQMDDVQQAFLSLITQVDVFNYNASSSVTTWLPETMMTSPMMNWKAE
jgi:hypothetical protein